MHKLIIVSAAALVAALAVPALGLGGDDGRTISEAKVLAPVQEPYTGAANAIRGVPGGGLPWEITRGKIELSSSGRLEAKIKGLVLARRAPVPVERQGVNPAAQFKAIVSCQGTVAGAAAVVNVESPLVAATATGDAEIEAKLTLPSPCYAPIVFVASATGSWFAVSGR